MSKGYYAIRPIVFHNIDDRNKFLELNSFYMPITRLEAQKIHKRLGMDSKIYCESCYELHKKDRVYKEKDDAK